MQIILPRGVSLRFSYSDIASSYVNFNPKQSCITVSLDAPFLPEYIFENATIVYVRRENEKENTEKISNKCAFYEEKFGAKIIYLNVDAIEISSTEIREAIGDKEKLKKLVSSDIYDYIQENKLYLDKEI